ncbi:hypothetical protein IHE45_20G018600 [Dioscorea alata]|uniref:Uncharacterized protein n=1 Tax=Dioscorea alata TaxID=55571 RepID=A0ACB7TQD1_DIOAL|nr:hypothetical protein IHE45_20G018600 [Dioscorea alata]
MLKLSGWPRLTWGRGARAGGGGRSSPPFSRRPSSSVGGAQGASPPRGGGATTSGTRRVAGPTLVAPRPALGEGGRRSSARRAAGGQSPRPAARARAGATRSSDAQAGVPSAGWPRAQLAFKDSMVHGILQFTPSIAFRYVLHRYESRDIRCRESCDSCVISFLRGDARRPGGAAARAEGRDVLGASRAGCGVMSSCPLHARGAAAAEAAPPVGGAGGRRGTPAGGRAGRRARSRACAPPRSPRPGRAPRFREFSGLPRVCGGSQQ